MKMKEESKPFGNIEEETEQNFILRSPTKGRLYRGSNWNAYNRESLGSIPRSSENILFKDKSNENKVAFSSQVGRFTTRNQSEKYTYPGPGKYDQINQEKFSKNPSHSIKGYGGFVSTTDRFENVRDWYEKFYPGPSDYKKEHLSIDNKISNSRLYKSIYYQDQNKSLKKSKENPGPGYYNPIMPILLVKDQEDKKQNFFFSSKEAQRLPIETINFSPGPARYYLNDVKNMNYIKDPHKTSYFFKDEIPRRQDIADKYLVQKKFDIKKSIPGPGDYELKSDIGKLKYDYSNINKKIISEKDRERDKQKEKELEEINVLKSIKKEAFMPYVSPFENLKKSARSVFLSKSPKEDYLKINHIPGPTYYQPNKLEQKMSYNWNSEKNWI